MWLCCGLVYSCAAELHTKVNSRNSDDSLLNHNPLIYGNKHQRVGVLLCVGYLCGRGGLQAIKAKRSAERSFVKIGEVTGLQVFQQRVTALASRSSAVRQVKSALSLLQQALLHS